MEKDIVVKMPLNDKHIFFLLEYIGIVHFALYTVDKIQKVGCCDLIQYWLSATNPRCLQTKVSPSRFVWPKFTDRQKDRQTLDKR